MKTAVLILARLGSTRLKDKHLIVARKKSYIEWLSLRFMKAFQHFGTEEVDVIITTSLNGDNLRFGEIFKSSGIKVFYGSDKNIPLRQLQCADHHNLTNIISVDGDDILCSTEGAIEVYVKLKRGLYAVTTKGLPLGMNCMGYKVAYLRKCLLNIEENSKLETGWGRIFDSSMDELKLGEYDRDKRLRFTLDYKEDATFFTNIIDYFGDRIFEVSDQELIQHVIVNKTYKINSFLGETYRQNFQKRKQEES